MWNLRRNDTTECVYKTERDLQTEKWTYGCQGEGVVRDLGKVMYTLLYLKWITNKDLLSSTWNSAQCYRPSWDGSGVWGRMDPCLCTAESLHCSSETTTTLLTGYTPIQKVFGVKKKRKIKKWNRGDNLISDSGIMQIEMAAITITKSFSVSYLSIK